MSRTVVSNVLTSLPSAAKSVAASSSDMTSFACRFWVV